MDDAQEHEQEQEQEQSEIRPSAAAAAPRPERATSLGDQVREVREHLERASAALAALDQLLPAATQPIDEPEHQPNQASDRSQP